jgi:hypothetical protein
MSGAGMAFLRQQSLEILGATMKRLFSFPDPVNEVSARLVAAGSSCSGS